jgi:hypothetical protein
MLEAAGQLTEAVQLFRQAQDWDSVARAIKQHALTLFYQGRWQTINDWYRVCRRRSPPAILGWFTGGLARSRPAIPCVPEVAGSRVHAVLRGQR